MSQQQIPFSKPDESATIPPAKELTAEQESKYAQVLEHFQTLEGILTAEKEKTTSPLTVREKAWLSKECFLRYFRATNWDVAHTIRRLESTLVWRRTFGVDFDKDLDPSSVEEEALTGKQVILGFDNDSRPCMYLKTGRQNTKPSHRQVQFLVFMLERTINFLPPGQESLALLIDFKFYEGVGLKSSKLPSLGTGREVLNILQDHYPERLGRALLVNLPRLASLFMKMIWPFIDPLTKEKINFSKPFNEYVPSVQLESLYGGSCDFEYNHEAYWPALCKMSEARLQHFYKRHEELGGGIGLSEADMRAGFDDTL